MMAPAPPQASAAARPEAAPRAAFHIPSLDGLRAISFLIVFVAHAGWDHLVPGGFGVTVFFFLSGYLITTLMRMEFEKTGRVDFKQFYLRRALRILPPFYLVLGTATGLTALGVLSGTLEVPAVLSQAFHYANYWIASHGYHGQATGTGVYWSLAVEEHFYFVFPALYLLFRKLKMSPLSQASAFLGLCLLVMAWRFFLVSQGAVENRTYVATDTRVDSILFGCMLAVYRNPILDDPKVPATSLWKWVMFPLGMAGLLFSFLYRNPAFRETWRYTLQGLSLIPLFVVAIRSPGFGPMRLLNTRPLAFIGTLSYSLYLVHHVIIYALLDRLPQVHVAVRLVLALGLAVGIAYVLYLYVEKPCADLRKKLSQPRKAPSA